MSNILRPSVRYALPILLGAGLLAQSTGTPEWTALTPVGGPPSARIHHTMAYDAASDRLILFGGSTFPGDTPAFDDVWVLKAASGVTGTPEWEQLAVAPGPGTRTGADAAYDAASNRLIVVGGAESVESSLHNDVWVLEHANGLGGTPAWIQLAPTGGPPAARFNFDTVYDAASNRLTLFGGQTGGCGNVLNDVWILTFANGLGGTPEWVPISAGGSLPAARRHATSVYDASANRMIVSGGQSGACFGSLDDTWALEHANGLGGTPTWVPLPGLPAEEARTGHAAALDPVAHTMMVFGGHTNTAKTNTVWIMSGTDAPPGEQTFTQIFPASEGPSARTSHDVVYAANAAVLVTFGGDGTFGGDNTDTTAWTLSFESGGGGGTPDADGDGVPDDLDGCPGTPAGQPVDATGCTVPTPPDADGDGVPDASDAFPLDSTESADTDGDGVGDNAEAAGVSGSDTVTTVVTALVLPLGIAFDSAGNLYIAEQNGFRVRKVDPSGSVTVVAGTGVSGNTGDGGPATTARLGQPFGLNVDPAGNLYITDSGNNNVRRVDAATGIITTVAGAGTAIALNLPFDVAFDAAGNVHVADLLGHRVVNLTTGLSVAGTGAAGFSGDGGPATAAKLNGVHAIRFDAAGNLYISEFFGHRVRKVDPAGVITTVAGNGIAGFSGDGGPAASAQLNNPAGLAFDAAGNLYVADWTNGVVRRVNVASGVIATVAGIAGGPVGSGVTRFSGDGGPATQAMFNTPAYLAFDADNNLYMSDTYNGRIRTVTATTDTDGDGVPNDDDAFPLDPDESVDTDGDGLGNNADDNDDGDSALDADDAFPLDAAESTDADSDGTGDNADLDDDDDGFFDVVDGCPLVPGPANGCTPGEAVDNLESDVATLDVTGGAEGALSKTLSAVDAAIDRGNVAAAQGLLGAFTRQIRALENSGLLSPSVAAALIADAEGIAAGL